MIESYFYGCTNKLFPGVVVLSAFSTVDGVSQLPVLMWTL